MRWDRGLVRFQILCRIDTLIARFSAVYPHVGAECDVGAGPGGEFPAAHVQIHTWRKKTWTVSTSECTVFSGPVLVIADTLLVWVIPTV